jgi:hypothetical protein
VVIEKEDLRLMLEQAGWAQRHDAMLISSKGFNTRAARDLVDAIAETTEPVRVFNAHDADAAGTVIQHTLQHATLARAARKIEIINIGLEPWEGCALGLQSERVPITRNKDDTPRRKPVGDYIKARKDRAPNGESWEQWLQHSRFELNAFSPAELLAWLDRKMAQHKAGKLIPPDDILTDQFGEHMRERVEIAVAAAIDLRRDQAIAAIETERNTATAPIREQIRQISEPLLAEIDRQTAELRQQLAATEQPFGEQITQAHTDASATDTDAAVAANIARVIPKPRQLRKDIGLRFGKEPTAHWLTMIARIAAATELGEVTLAPTRGRR